MLFSASKMDTRSNMNVPLQSGSRIISHLPNQS